MIVNLKRYRVVRAFGYKQVGTILEWDSAIAGPRVLRGQLEEVEDTEGAVDPEGAVETMAVDPPTEKAIRKRGRPRKRGKVEHRANA